MSRDIKWTNLSVIKFAGNSDPIEFITQKARDEILCAVQNGWQGPPFDPFKLAEYFGIRTVPKEDVLDARTIPTRTNKLQIEYNPNRTRERLRFSIAHELAHSLFPDCCEQIRNRVIHSNVQEDDWQLELLCNIAAAELLMPVGNEIDSKTEITAENILKLQKEYEVSTEAICIRLAKLTEEPCIIIAAARTRDDENSNVYRTDYSITSRASTLNLPRGIEINSKLFSQCTAVGYTAKGKERNLGRLPELYLECIGIPPYPGQRFPRVIGIGYSTDYREPFITKLKQIRGDALKPRGTGNKIIAHIVNDKTTNWGAGFGRAVKTAYPQTQKDFAKWATLNPDMFSLGNVQLTAITDELYIAHMIAQHGYGESTKPRIRYAALKNCLMKLKDTAINVNASVHMPRIGTGYAGGNWRFILELLDNTLVSNGIDVTIYALPEYEPVVTQGELNLNSLSNYRYLDKE